MIIFGTRLFGKVDAVPGMFHVATKFAHLNFLPLIPLQGWLVLSQEGSSWRGVSIPISMKSVAVAWIRFLLFCFALFGLIGGFVAFTSGEGGGIGLIVVGLLGVSCFIGTYYWSWIARADMERAVELARLAGLNEEGVEQVRNAYGPGTWK